ncbi:amino acid adenylation domain-containing protein, partial [Fulvivirga kasyanovii]|uniref:amino acid adenylation domain-containing protein n=1 Tax=Fulvivirga kasyanovii TaxID=396812 RepID=UPI0031DE8777
MENNIPMNTENQIKQKLAEDFLLQKIKSVQDIELFQAKGTPVLKKETVALEPDAINEIYGIARENSFSEYLLYLTAYAILLNKYFNHREYLIVSPDLILPERPVTEGQTLFFKAAADPENTLKEVIKGIKEEVQSTLRYAAYDYSEVEPELSKNEGIFQYGFLFSELSASSPKLNRSKLVLSISRKKKGGVTAEVTYDAGVFDKEFIVQFLGHFKNLTRQIKSGLDTPVHEIDVLSDGEKEIQLSAHTFHTVTYPHQATIQEIFEKIALKHPDHIAVSYEGERISYKELNSRANQLAHYLRKSYVIKGDTLIGLMGAPSDKIIVAILAILKSGGAYVPVDPDYPEARIKHTIADSGMKLLLVDSQEAVKKNDLPCEVVSLDNENLWRDAPVCNPELINASTDMAYVIYTSGSTGVPKGVMVEHKNVVQLFCNDQFQFDVDSTDVWTLFHSVCFDFSVWEIFGAILYGGRLVVISKDTARSPEKYVDIIEQEKVTVVNQIPTTFKNVASEILNRENINIHIRYVIFGGDALNPVALKAWHEKYPDVKLINMYGITETTVHVTYKEIGAKEIAASLSNIGYPLAPMGIFIMDDHHHLKPANTVGEIVVNGEGVTRGYLNRDELNKKHFIANPYNTREKLYCSGDLGLRLSSGEIIYVGRKDKQIKIRGYRIEIREIEHVLLSHDLIQDAVIVGHEGSDGEKELAAYLTARSPLNINQLRTHLAEKLPAYMIPSYFVQLERMPLTGNGKVDRKALPHPGIGSLETGEEFIAPTNDLEQKLADLWSSVLAKEQVGITDNYFALGGDSMKAVKLIVEINKILNIRIGIGALFTFQTIRELAGHIKEEQQKRNSVDVLAIGLQKIKKLKEEIIQLEADKLPAGYTDIYPVSNIEKGMIYSSILNEEEYIFYDQFAFQLEINKTEQFDQAISVLVKRHDMLRTRYFISTFSEPVKVVMDDIDLPYTVEDLRGRSKADQKEHIKQYRAEDLKIRLTFNGDILWRLKAFQLSDRHFYLVWSTHHALLDGWSEMIFYTDLSRMLAGTDALVDLPPIRHTYKHYTAIELGREDNEEIKEFWNGKLAGYTRNKLPFNYAGKRKQDTPGVDRFSAAFDPHILKSFETIAEQNNVSLRSVFLSAYLYLLNIICAENDVVAGIVSHDRPAIEDSEKILGCFLNVIPVRLDFKDIKDAKSLIKAVNSYLVEARPNEMYLADIARAIGEKASNANNPIFDCLLNFVNFHNVEEWQENEAFDVNHDIFGNDAELGNEGMTNTLFDLEVSVTEQNLFVILRYRKAYFDRGDMERAWNLFARILESFAAGIDTPLHSELLLSNEDKQEILHDFNDTVVPYSATKTMHRLFEEKAAQIPGHTALEQEDASITYEELNICANQIARQLLKNGVKNGDNVALITGRNFDMIKAMLGILKAGASYVPVDPEYPLDRQIYIIENSDVSCVLVDASYPIAEAKGELSFVDLRDDSIKDNDVTNLDIEKPATDLAYTIYTSGSTGRPKGVMIEHHSAVNLIEWVNNEFAINENDKLLFITSMCFDLSVYDIFGMLAGGGTVVIARESEVKDVTLLENLIRDKGITFWDSVPTTMNYLVREMEAAGKTESIESLRLIFMSGDWIPVDLKERIHPYFPNARVISLGGATEGTVWSNYFPIEKVEPEWASIPYGKPLANNFFYILDDNLQPVPKGVMGELFIGGVGVARGYANEPEKTSSSFVKDPFHPEQGGMMYRTGDLGRLMPDGNMEFLGRKDHQVKIRGYRVELGEIESCLTKHPSVKETVVMARKDKAGNSYLCAYLVAGKEVSNAELREHVLATLPAYMVPSYYIMLEALPLTPNGKINRKALPEPEAREVEAGTAYLAPRNELEEKLAGLWRKILNRSKVGVHDNFMEIGAHSLSIGAFVNQVFREFDISLSIGDVFEQPTIAGVTALMATMQGQEEEKLQVVEGEYFDLSNAQRRLWIVSQIEDNPVAYHMPAAHRFKGKLDLEVFKKVFDTLIERHESLRTVFVTVDGEPKQYISDPETFNFSLGYTDVREVKDKDAHVEQLITREAHTKFNLEKGPLVRAGIIHKEQDEYIFLFTMHHIISDGWSLEVLAEEIFILYDAYIHGRPNPLAPLRVQYKDFAAWQNDQLRGDNLQAHQQYWTNEYQGEIPVLELPADKPRPRVKTYNSHNHVLSLDKQISDEVKTFARNKEASIFMVLLASVKALLHRYSSQDDIIVGSPVSGRDNQELENQVGFYLNILTFRTLFEEEESFASLVENIRNKAVEHYKHQVYPFDRLVEDLQLSRDTSRSALFDVLVVSHDISLNTFEHTVEGMKDITLLGTEETLPQNKYDISIYFHDTEEGIKVKFSYNQDL